MLSARPPDELRWKFPELKNIHLGRDVTFITTQELEDMCPDYTPKQRENVLPRAWDHLHHEDRRQAQERQAPRRPRPRLR